ncbi:MAG: flagellar motor switch protein [Brevirhabdus sp.]
MLSTFIDTAIILLLAGATVYGYAISRKVQRLMSVLVQLEPLVREFSDAVDKSEESVEMLRENLEETEAKREAPAAAPAPAAPFSSRRAAPDRMAGLHPVRDKKALVQMFFDTTRSESRA